MLKFANQGFIFLEVRLKSSLDCFLKAVSIVFCLQGEEECRCRL